MAGDRKFERTLIAHSLAELHQHLARKVVDAPRVGILHPERLPDGSVLDRRYRIVRYLASGAMGDVYKAVDMVLGTPVAVKTIKATTADDDEVLARFRREAALARAVTDPHVCRIFDIGQVEFAHRRVHYVTMELLGGETLHARRRREPAWFTPEVARALAGDVLGGLAAVHRAGIVHRDLKPENVFLVERDDRTHAVLTDFGIARQEVVAAGAPSLTREGVFIGSPAFMAPEQFNAAPAVPRTDIYAVGAVLWELIVGPWPLATMNTVEIVHRVSVEFPATRDFPPQVPRAWQAAIQGCRRLDQGSRFASAAEANAALDAAPPARRWWRWLLPVVAAGLAAAAAAYALA